MSQSVTYMTMTVDEQTKLLQQAVNLTLSQRQKDIEEVRSKLYLLKKAFTVKEAADYANTSEAWILSHIKKGNLKKRGVKNGATYISKDELDQFLLQEK